VTRFTANRRALINAKAREARSIAGHTYLIDDLLSGTSKETHLQPMELASAVGTDYGIQGIEL